MPAPVRYDARADEGDSGLCALLLKEGGLLLLCALIRQPGDRCDELLWVAVVSIVTLSILLRLWVTWGQSTVCCCWHMSGRQIDELSEYFSEVTNPSVQETEFAMKEMQWWLMPISRWPSGLDLWAIHFTGCQLAHLLTRQRPFNLACHGPLHKSMIVWGGGLDTLPHRGSNLKVRIPGLGAMFI